MIEKLEIKNLQSHRASRFNFHPNVNVIYGISQSGKTAGVVRSVNLCRSNRPLGFRYHSHFADEKEPTVVELKPVETDPIVFRKDKKGASYKFGSYSFEGIGTDVPDVIVDALNLSDLNVQNQLDQHFLITSSPGEVARTINRVTQLEKVDRWISQLTTQVNSANKEISILEKQQEGILEELKLYENIPELESLLEKAEEVDLGIKQAERERKELEEISAKLSQLKEDEEGLSEWISGVEKLLVGVESCLSSVDELEKEKALIVSILSVGDAIEKVQSFLQVEKILVNAESCLDSIDELEKEKALIVNVLDVVDAIERGEAFLQVEKPVKEAAEVLGEIEKLEMEFEHLDEMRVKLKDKGLEIEDSEDKQEEALKFYKGLLEQMGTCPTCFAEISKGRIKEILGKM